MSTGSKAQQRKVAREGVEVDFLTGFHRYMPNLYGVVLGQSRIRAYRVNIYQRDDKTWLVVVAATDPVDGHGIVAFGNGTTANAALSAVDKAIAAGKWREDKRAGGTVVVGVHAPNPGVWGSGLPKDDPDKFVQSAGDKQLKLL